MSRVHSLRHTRLSLRPTASLLKIPTLQTLKLQIPTLLRLLLPMPILLLLPPLRKIRKTSRKTPSKSRTQMKERTKTTRTT